MLRRSRRNLLAYIAAHVRRLRQARGLTQEALAERAGLELRYVQKVERAEVNMGVTTLAGLAEALGVGPGVLFEPTRPLPPPKRGRPVRVRATEVRARGRRSGGT